MSEILESTHKVYEVGDVKLTQVSEYSWLIEHKNFITFSVDDLHNLNLIISKILIENKMSRISVDK